LIYQLYCLLAITGFAHEFHIGIALAHYEGSLTRKETSSVLLAVLFKIYLAKLLLADVSVWTVCSSTDKVSHVVHSLCLIEAF
jgi:hypothetical protein